MVSAEFSTMSLPAPLEVMVVTVPCKVAAWPVAPATNAPPGVMLSAPLLVMSPPFTAMSPVSVVLPATATVPVKLAALDIVWPLYVPAVTAPVAFMVPPTSSVKPGKLLLPRPMPTRPVPVAESTVNTLLPALLLMSIRSVRSVLGRIYKLPCMPKPTKMVPRPEPLEPRRLRKFWPEPSVEFAS